MRMINWIFAQDKYFSLPTITEQENLALVIIQRFLPLLIEFNIKYEDILWRKPSCEFYGSCFAE